MSKTTKIIASLFITVPVILLIGALGLRIMREPYTNDSLPENLSDQIKLIKIDAYPDNLDTSAVDCMENSLVVEYLTSRYPETIDFEFRRCNMYSFSDTATVFFLDSDSMLDEQQLLLGREGTSIEEIVVTKNVYPGNRISDVRVVEGKIYFTYSGWQNPSKVIEVTML